MARQTLCVQYLVSDELDGLTPAPQLAAPRSTGNVHQIYQPQNSIEKLGLIDPDFTPEGPASGISNRLLSFVWITGAQAGDADARVAVVDAEDPNTPLTQQVVADMAGQESLYLPTGVFLPQGSSLQVRGLRPVPGGLVKVRLYVDVLDSALATAAALEAICCASGGGFSPLELSSLTYDYRDTTANPGNSFVPTGTTATAHALRVPQRSVLTSFFIWGVIPPAAGESVAIRLYRYTPTSFQQVTSTFVLTAGNFVSSTKIDLSANILPVAFDADDILACSYVHSGPQQLQPLLTGWTFGPVPDLLALANPVANPLMWPPP